MHKSSLYRVKRVLVNSVLMLLFWIALSGTDPAGIALGVVVVTVCYLIFGKRLTILQAVRYDLRSLGSALGFAWAFARSLLASNLDVALRIIRPGLPIAPGIVEIPTQLQAPLAIMAISYAITLTPGTIMIECSEGSLFVHAINVESEESIESMKKTIAGYESYLVRIFE